jgi:serine/threonine protein kinase
MNEWVGRMLNKVHIDSLIARGGMAEVYLGTHTTLQREVAVKILRNQYEEDEDLLERFQREARVVAKLRHQNIVQVFDYDAVDERPYIVMEYVSGPSLSKYLSKLHKNKGKLELQEVNRILTGVAQALQYAHESGVVHRDIKPGNIILNSHSQPVNPGQPLPEDFEPVLTDFGLVRFLNSSRQTSAGQTAGTPAYMSPEQARGETTDGRTDIYSLGIVLYEMLSGKVPFDGETTMSILLKHVSDPPPPIPGLLPELQKVLDKALAKNKEDRFQKPIELARVFNSVVNAQTEPSTFMGITPVEQPVTITLAEPVDSLIVVNTPRQQFLRWPTIALAASGLALLGVIYFAFNGAFASVPPPISPTASPSIPAPTKTSKANLGLLNSTAILHFKDGDAVMDQVVLEALAMPSAPQGTQYDVWLVSPDGKLSLGILQVDYSGKGKLTYYASQDENLLAIYDRVEIMIKPLDAKSSEKERIAYSYSIPPEGLVFLRQLLVASADIPDQAPLIQAFSSETELLENAANEMLDAYTSNDVKGTTDQAEAILNLLAGSDSQDYRDWNGNGTISNLGKGFGFLRNGNKLGYIQAVFAQADYIANSAGANQNMIFYSGQVKACAENLAVWASQLKEQALQIVTASSLAEMETPVKAASELAKKIRFGTDLNENSTSEPISGECGVATAYLSAYAMADMPLLPIGFGTPTAVGSGTPGILYYGTLTPGSGGGGGSGGGSGQPTAKVPPGQQRTKVPNPGGGGGGGGGGGNGGGNSNKP